ncbi:MAG TPA: HAD hydrolase-like protein [Baekduia sp.]|uniref:HAD family hydrolase n=1 Tax=Baekduia sp. TaxID=2600305 RepID=UPI002BC37DC6|nr:HAD hydrolase-like protein [Baekduia sp.]HMJ33959.1 HAD hydrolase-like protein [Baekduia sp.]
MAAAALFDWDGTLLDSRDAILTAWHASSEARIGRRFPASAAEDELVFTRPGLELFSALSDGDPADTAAFVAAFQEAYADSGRAVRAFDGVAEMLVALRAAGVAIGVVTSKARRRLNADVGHAGLDGLIDAAICVEDVAFHKPDPAPVLAALMALSAAPADAAMAGDTPVDIAAGRAAGTAAALGVAWGASGPGPLQAAGAAAVASDAAALTEMILAAVCHHEPRKVSAP